MEARKFAKFVLLISIVLLTLFIPSDIWPVAAQSPHTTSCSNAFGPVHQWGSTGSGPGEFKAPVAVAVDKYGNVHVVDRDNRRVQKFNPLGSYLFEYGNENGRVMLNPNGIDAGPNDYIYIADTDQHRILIYDNITGTNQGGWKDGDGGAQWRMLNPWGVASWEDSGTKNTYVVDRNVCQILQFNSIGQFIDKWGGNCSSAEWLLFSPQDVATYINPNPFNIFLYIADTGSNRIAKYDYHLNPIFNWGATGTANGQFNQPSSVATDADGCVYVADTGNHRIQVFDDQGGFVTKFGSQGSGSGQLQSPRGVAVGSNGCVYVADTGNNRVVVYCPQSSPPPGKSVDVFIRDNIIDTGVIPSVKPWWESPDIWIRHAPDGQEFPESPILGQTNYIHVRAHNLGNVPLDNVEAAVYCAPPSEAPPWPDAWIYIGSTHLSEIVSHGEKAGYLPWNPSGACLQILEMYNHMCLLVRLITVQDPIQNEGSVPWDNNIAQLNVHQFKNWTGSKNLNATTLNESVTFLIGNPFDTFQAADVEFDRGDFPTGGQIEVYLDETLFDQWQAVGGSVEGGAINLAQKKIEITSTSLGVIKGLPIEAKQQFLTMMQVTAASDQFFSIAVSELINGEYVGGNLYTTNFASHSEMIDLSASTNTMPPNSTQTISAIVFGSGKMPVKDGTIVNFSTTLGTITNQATTVNGVATVQLTSGDIIGTTQVIATTDSTTSTPLEISIGSPVYLPIIVKGIQ